MNKKFNSIIAVDPGPRQSGIVLYDPRDHIVLRADIKSNDHAGRYIDDCFTLSADRGGAIFAIEKVASYGMPVGEDVFETCRWSGRFWEQWTSRRGSDPLWIIRMQVKMNICNDSRARDSNIRQALLDMFPQTGGGKTPQIGTKSKPGPLYGFKGDLWAALAVAITAAKIISRK